MPEVDLKSKKHAPRWLVIVCLILAGEMIFSLPFHVPRFFRPTLLEVLNMSNAEFGDAFVLYGVMAMLSYIPGGMIADRISARKLIAYSLVATAIGGIFLAMFPGQVGLAMIFGYWGITTVLLLWAAMIRATREWGGEFAQGKAFGLLDGGRGLASAGAASLAVILLAYVLPENLDAVTTENRSSAIRSVIYFYSLATFVTAVLVWFFIPDSKLDTKKSEFGRFPGIKYVITNPSVWLQALVVICAYVGYKGLDYYTTYAVDILGLDEVKAAKYMSYASYLRAFSAIVAGFIADKITSRKVIGISFTLVLVNYIILMFLYPEPEFISIIYANLILTFMAVYALRGVYFALIGETKVRGRYTGTAVGLISVIGFTPDIFFYSAGGRIIDASPGFPGFRNYFMFLAVFALIGMLATLVLLLRNRFHDHSK
jgi:nitrate/nitrite transporter NarK